VKISERQFSRYLQDFLDNAPTQQYSCVYMIPAFVDIGGPRKVLPPGVHNATLEEVEKRFAMSDHRKYL